MHLWIMFPVGLKAVLLILMELHSNAESGFHIGML